VENPPSPPGKPAIIVARLSLAPGTAAPAGEARASGPAVSARGPDEPAPAGCRTRVFAKARADGVSDGTPEDALATPERCFLLVRAPAVLSPGERPLIMSPRSLKAAKPAIDAPPPRAVAETTAISAIPPLSAMNLLLRKRTGILIRLLRKHLWLRPRMLRSGKKLAMQRKKRLLAPHRDNCSAWDSNASRGERASVYIWPKKSTAR
jgi:hypothetical protein